MCAYLQSIEIILGSFLLDSVLNCSYLTMDSAECEFSQYFESLTQMHEKRAICRIFLRQKFFNYLKLLAEVLVVVLVLYWTWQTFDCISWFLSASMRLGLIKMLPYWDWTTLYNTQCLIIRNPDIAVDMKNSITPSDYGAENCLLCASLEYVPNISNVNFGDLEIDYLESGVPIVITDSHEPQTLFNFVNKILDQDVNYLETEACDISTNLMLKERFNMEIAFRKLETANKAFLQLRNCQFNAVKLSRVFIEKPYYYPAHLEPFYSSWLILSRNIVLHETELYVNGLILVQQWQGYINILLKPKEVCTQSCLDVNIRLFGGEALLFSTDLWTLSYNLFSKDEATLTTILEIDWKF